MSFYEVLQSETEEERKFLLSSPIIHRCLDGDITLDDYVEFLSQAYHHVKHTVPLLMATGSRLPEDKVMVCVKQLPSTSKKSLVTRNGF